MEKFIEMNKPTFYIPDNAANNGWASKIDSYKFFLKKEISFFELTILLQSLLEGYIIFAKIIW